MVTSRPRRLCRLDQRQQRRLFAGHGVGDDGDQRLDLAGELEALPGLIEKLEAQQAELLGLIGNPDFYQKPASEVTRVQSSMATVEAELSAAYARWEELEEKRMAL